MADISVTASAVKPANSNTSIGRGTAGTGATITAGQVLWADSTDSFKLKPALSSNQTQASNVVGIALHGASDGQPVAYAYAGDVTFNAVLLAATTYVLGSAAGAISASADLDSSTNTRYGVVLGMATSTTNLRMGIIISGVLNP